MIAILFIALLVFVNANAQMEERFSDGDFYHNPAWMGDTSVWKVNDSLELQSNSLLANSVFQLSVASMMLEATQWDLDVRLLFNTSSANYTDVYLAANAPDFAMVNTLGYFVRLGGTQDEISLYKKNPNGVLVKLIDGVDGVLNSASNRLKLRVICTSGHLFELSYDLSFTGNEYHVAGQTMDSTYLSSQYFGICIRQSTSSFFQRHFFDNISIKNYEPDLSPPFILSAVAKSDRRVDVRFNEPIEPTSASVPSNYRIENFSGLIDSGAIDAVDNCLIHVYVSRPFENAQYYKITVNDLADCYTNYLSSDSTRFYFYKPRRYDVVIHEFMADPTPTAGLPEAEWLEVRNVGPFPIDLSGWRIADASSESGMIPSYSLQPDSLVVLMSTSSRTLFSNIRNAIGISGFPSLDNEGDLLYLLADDRNIIHSIRYDMSWYRNSLKKMGGWSMEMMDVRNPCSGKTNWKESESILGGSPGRTNTVATVYQDKDPPRWLRSFAPDSMHIVLVANEPLKDSGVNQAINYHFDIAGISVDTAFLSPPLFTEVTLSLRNPLQRGVIYQLAVSDICDCAGNFISSSDNIRVGLAELADSAELVLNELLFNPSTGGSDFVELYHKGKHILDASKLFIGNRNSMGQPDAMVPLSSLPWLIFPGDFILLTENPAWVAPHFPGLNESACIPVASMPSMNDDAGVVLLMNAQGNILDEVSYRSDWHLPLLNNLEDVSLERINYQGNSNDSDNWHSAASPDFGTPGRMNSQTTEVTTSNSIFGFSSELFSPNNDGLDDYLQVTYSFHRPGFLLSVTIFDALGRPIRPLKQNYLCGKSGSLVWDGLGTNYQTLRSGIYILYLEAFNLQGEKIRFKKAVVLKNSF